MEVYREATEFLPDIKAALKKRKRCLISSNPNYGGFIVKQTCDSNFILTEIKIFGMPDADYLFSSVDSVIQYLERNMIPVKGVR